jgi:hypothetical protein
MNTRDWFVQFSENIDAPSPLYSLKSQRSKSSHNSPCDEFMRMHVNTNSHSQARRRVYGPTMNCPKFYKTFNIQPGDKMYLPEDKGVLAGLSMYFCLFIGHGLCTKEE